MTRLLGDVCDGGALGGCGTYGSGCVEESTGAGGAFRIPLCLLPETYGLAQGDAADWTA
jgi:hypothetical protein